MIAEKQRGRQTARPAQIRSSEVGDEDESFEDVPDYALTIFFTKAGYFKKITPQSLRMSGEQKLKEGDELSQVIESSNAKELLFFTDKCQVYKARVSDFDDSKASVLGDYIPTALEFDDGEQPLYMAVTDDFKGYMLFFFENGKVAKVDMSAYETKKVTDSCGNVYT